MVKQTNEIGRVPRQIFSINVSKQVCSSVLSGFLNHFDSESMSINGCENR